ncbi:hypothetical protein [Maridesulfovibrio sp.]|uniref:hypothetical protein n=1 Tax=Maridesulfovibrio sp. TaxID=2795000 RepID=UPI0029CA026E|nr:hypothetical protein [Maridesulfovibrio sp.]
MKYRLILLAVILCVLSVSAASAQDGEVNWTAGVVSSVGMGTATSSGNKAKDKIKAIRAGKILAARNLLETIKGVHIDGRTLVVDAVLEKEVIASRVNGMIRAARVIRTDVSIEDDGSVLAEVELAVCLNGRGKCKGMPNLAEAVDYETALRSPAVPEKTYIPDTESLQSILGSIDKTESVKKGPSEELHTKELSDVSGLFEDSKLSEEPELSDPDELSAENENSEINELFDAGETAKENIIKRVTTPVPGMTPFDPAKSATGLVVALQGHRFEQTLLPVIAVRTKDGSTAAIYSIKVIDPASFRDRGMARYAASVSEAARMNELGDNVILAKGQYGNEPGLIMLNEKDAWAISEQARRGSPFLKQGNVVICIP